MPLGLRVFRTALAIADDLLAVLVIAVSYTTDLDLAALGAAALTTLALVAANLLGVRRPLVYGVLGIALWLAVFQSGVHGTVAGVLLAFTIPARTRLDAAAFAHRARAIVDDFEARTAAGEDVRGEEYGQGPPLDFAKVGILAASAVAGIGGYLVLRRAATRTARA